MHICCGIVQRADKLLITQREAQSHLGGFWEFPGGKRKPDETDAQAVVREVFEETGLTIEVGPLFYQTSFTYPERTVHLHFYLCTTDDRTEVQCREVAQARWVHPGELSQYTFPPANEALIQQLAALTFS